MIVKRDDGGAGGRAESNGGSLRIEACRAGCHRAWSRLLTVVET